MKVLHKLFVHEPLVTLISLCSLLVFSQQKKKELFLISQLLSVKKPIIQTLEEFLIYFPSVFLNAVLCNMSLFLSVFLSN